MAARRNSKVVAAGAAERPAVRSTKRITGGNSICDRAWMEAEAEFLREVDPEEIPDKKETYWDIKYQWDGDQEDINPEFWDEWRRGPRRCSGISYIRDERGGYIMDREWDRLRRPCLRPPMHGGSVCARHGGQVAAIRNAANVRLGMAAEKAANALITMTNSRDEEGELIDHRVRVAAANSVLDRTGIKAGSEVEVTIPGYRRVLEKLFADDAPEESGE